MACQLPEHAAMFGDGEGLKEKETDFVWLKVSVLLPFIVQSKFKFEFIYDHENGFCALMIHLVQPGRKYEGGMQHKMIQI